METTISSEISVTVYRSKRLLLPEKCNFNEDGCAVSNHSVSRLTAHSNMSVQILVE